VQNLDLETANAESDYAAIHNEGMFWNVSTTTDLLMETALLRSHQVVERK